MSQAGPFNLLSSSTAVTSVTGIAPILANGVSGTPEVGDVTVSLSTPLSEVYGGTHQSTYTLGDTLYSSAANTLSKLPGNNQSILMVLSQLGDGTNSAAPVWIPLPTTSTSIYMFANIASSIGGYFQAVLSSLYVVGTTGSAAASVSTTPTLIVSFATNSGYPNLTNIPPGLFVVHYETQKSTGGNSYYSYAQIYKRTSGGVETLLLTSDNSTTTSANTLQQITVTAYNPFNIALSSTDRIVVKIWAVMTTSSNTITVYWDDATNSRIEIPISSTSTTITATAPLTANGLSGTPQAGSVTLAISGTGYVSSISGTANQISASASTGAVTLSLTNGISIGSYQATTPPSGGLICPGQVGIGISAPGGYLDVIGTQSASGAVYGTLLRTNVTETGSASGTCGVYIGGTHTVNGSGLNTASFMQVSPTVTATSTVSAAYGINIFPGSATGTVNAAYGIYANNPGFGTAKAAIYTDNLSIGYAATTPPTNGAIITGAVGIGTSAPTANTLLQTTLRTTDTYGRILTGTTNAVDGSNTQIGDYLNNTFAPTNGSSASYQSYSTPVFAIPTGKTGSVVTCYTASPKYTGNAGAITTSYGFYYDGGGTLPAGSIDIAYGAYLLAPQAGTRKIGLYTDTALVGSGFTGYGSYPSGSLFVATGIGVGVGAFSDAGLEIVKTVSATDGVIRVVGTNTYPAATGSNGIYARTGHAPTSNSNASSFYIDPVMQPPTGVTIARASGVYITAGVSGGLGSVTVGYGLYVNAPTFGTTKVASYTDNLSVGYTAIAPPSSGAIISGKVGIGTSSVDSNSYVEMLSSGPYTLRLAGTITSTVNNQQASLWIRSALQPTSGNIGVSAHIFNQAFTIAPLGQTIANAAACFLAQDYEFNAGTITNAYQLLISTTASGTGTGSITNAYGAYITAPNAGTKICALYTDNLSIGYTATTPPTNGAIISGKVGIGTSAPASTTSHLQIDGSASQASTYNGALITPTLTQTGNGQSTQILQVAGTQVVNGTGTNSAEIIRVNGAFTATTTINNAFGIHVLAHSGSGTINQGYGLFVENPGVGTTKTATYTENLSVGYTAVSPPTTGAIITGQVGIGTSAPNTSALLHLSSTSKGFLMPLNSNPPSGVSSPTDGVMVYNNEVNKKIPQFYNGNDWISVGGFSLLQALSFSNAAAIEYLDGTAIPLTEFQTWLIVFENLLPATDSATFEFQVSTDGGSTYLTSGYAGGATSNATASSATWANVNTTSYVTCGALRNTSPAWGYIYVGNRNQVDTTFTGVFSQLGSISLVNSYNPTAGANAFKIFFSSGNISTVTICVYGLHGSQGG